MVLADVKVLRKRYVHLNFLGLEIKLWKPSEVHKNHK